MRITIKSATLHIIALSFCLFSPNVVAQIELSRIPIKAGLVILAPDVMRTSSDECYGAAIDNLTKLFPEKQFDLVITCASAARIYREFSSAKIDMSINIKSNAQLSEFGLFTNIPYSVFNVMLYKNSLRTDKSISATDKFTYHGMHDALAKQAYQFEYHPNNKKALTVFLRGGTSNLLSYQRTFDYYLQDGQKTNLFDALNMEIEERSLIEVPLYIVIHNHYAHKTKLVEHINDYASTHAKNNKHMAMFE